MTERQFAIAVDLGGTSLRAALVDDTGQLLDRAEVATKAIAGPAAVIGQITQLVRDLKIGGRPIAGIGVASPGPLDTKLGITLTVPTIAGMDEFPLRAELQKKFPYHVALENDGISAAIGEWKFGAGRGFENLVYVTVSTGIGGGVIIDNKVLRGRRGMAGHVGHMSIMLDGDLCVCGNRGCFEAYGSGPAFNARAIANAKGNIQTLLGQNGKAITSQSIFSAAKSGDALALELVTEEGKILGTGFTSLAHLYSPDLIVMGGGLSNEFEALAPFINTQFQASAMPAFKDIPIKPASLGQNSGLIGAACLVFESSTKLGS
jgi:glucokinase